MTPPQARAARALLNWTQADLANASGVSVSTVQDFEKERRPVSEAAITSMLDAVLACGIELINDGDILPNRGGAGVRFQEASDEALVKIQIDKIDRRLFEIGANVIALDQILKVSSLDNHTMNSLRMEREALIHERLTLEDNKDRLQGKPKLFMRTSGMRHLDVRRDGSD